MKFYFLQKQITKLKIWIINFSLSNWFCVGEKNITSFIYTYFIRCSILTYNCIKFLVLNNRINIYIYICIIGIDIKKQFISSRDIKWDFSVLKIVFPGNWWKPSITDNNHCHFIFRQKESSYRTVIVSLRVDLLKDTTC